MRLCFHYGGIMTHPGKYQAIALAGLLAMSAFSVKVIAHNYERCDPDGDHCVRVHCDSDGDRCWRESEYGSQEQYKRPGQWVCDADGDRCHYAYTGRTWNPHWEHHDHDRDDGGHDH